MSGFKRRAGPFLGNEPKDGPARIVTRRASEITPEPVSWLWKYWLARGKFHELAGVPETGKTTIAQSFAAIVSEPGQPEGSS